MNIQLSDRRSSTSYPCDLVVLCLGDRYPPGQFHCMAELEDALMQLAAGGGIVGTVVATHEKMGLPTSAEPRGLRAKSDGKVMNVADYALPVRAPYNDVTVIGVLETR